MNHYTTAKLPGEYAGKHPLAANTVIPTNGLVALDASGNALPAASTVTGFVVGTAVAGVDNTGGSAADVSVLVERGVRLMPLAATNPPTKAHVGKQVYAITPDTVAHTGTCRAGTLLGFEGTLAILSLDARAGVAVTLGSANSEIYDLTIGATYAQAEVSAIKSKAEELADDVRAIHAALVNSGIVL